jgi:site-specific recombinase XerC
MPRHSPRKRIAKYVYQDGSGIAAVVYVKGHKTVELRFPLKTPLAEIRRAQELRAAQLHAMTPTLALGTVAQVIDAYLARLGETLPELDERGRLRAWVHACGSDDFATQTKTRLNGIVADWLREGYNQSTLAKRISSFRKVAQAVADARLEDDGRVHAIFLIKRPKTPRSGDIRARTLELVQRIINNVADKNLTTGAPSKCKARLAVWAWTGQNPALLQQLTPEDVNWTTTPPQLYLQPRRKGEGVDAGWIPLLPQAVDALREFFARDAGGEWNKGVVLRGFKTAVKKTQRDLRREHRHQDATRLEGMLPRDLRHSIATALVEASGDVFGVAEYLRHADIKTTLRYTKGAASTRTQAVVAALGATLNSPKEKCPPLLQKVLQKNTQKWGAKGENAPHSATHRHKTELTTGL